MVYQVQCNCIGRWWNRRFVMVTIEVKLFIGALFVLCPRISKCCSPSYVCFTIYVIFCARSVPVFCVSLHYWLASHPRMKSFNETCHDKCGSSISDSLSKDQNASFRICTYKNESSLAASIFLS